MPFAPSNVLAPSSKARTPMFQRSPSVLISASTERLRLLARLAADDPKVCRTSHGNG